RRKSPLTYVIRPSKQLSLQEHITYLDESQRSLNMQPSRKHQPYVVNRKDSQQGCSRQESRNYEDIGMVSGFCPNSTRKCGLQLPFCRVSTLKGSERNESEGLGRSVLKHSSMNPSGAT
ncbi:8866_t:CDS:2, partial [Funneliformis caledonium]